jgi:hypothetical protein
LRLEKRVIGGGLLSALIRHAQYIFRGGKVHGLAPLFTKYPDRVISEDTSVLACPSPFWIGL